MRLIDANALRDEVDKSKHNNPHPQGMIRVNHRNEHDHFLRMILDAPTVDAVEVMRCKDCMWSRPKDHREPTLTPRELVCQCAKHHYIPAPWGARMAVSPDDFCSYGERREGE